MTRRYFVHGVELETQIPFTRPAETSLAVGAPPARLVLLERKAIVREQPTVWLLHRSFLDAAEPWLSVARLADSYLLRVHGYADFFSDVDGQVVECTPEPGVPVEDLEGMFFDQILPQVLHLRGQPSLHASAVAIGDRVVGFLGKSGSGKSTLAGSLAEHFPLVADDCLTLRLQGRVATVLPGYPAVRLNEDVATALFTSRGDLPRTSPHRQKRRVDFESFGAPLRLHRLYFIEAADCSPEVVPVRKPAAFMELTEHLHRLDPENRERMKEEVAFLTWLVDTIPVARLRYRRNLDELADVHQAVVEDVARGDTAE